MFGRLFVAACTLGLAAAASCDVNPDGSCATAGVCISECSRRHFSSTCSAISGCTWNTDLRYCLPTDSTLEARCNNQTLSADCGGLAGCYWDTQQCVTSHFCGQVDSSDPEPRCALGTNASGCTTISPKCQWSNQCGEAPPCSYYSSPLNIDNGCSSAPGCMWIESLTNGTERPSCTECLMDPETSMLLTVRSLIGKTCTSTNAATNNTTQTSITQALKVTPAASGCSGGQPYTLPATMVCTGAAFGLTVSTSFAVVMISLLA